MRIKIDTEAIFKLTCHGSANLAFKLVSELIMATVFTKLACCLSSSHDSLATLMPDIGRKSPVFMFNTSAVLNCVHIKSKEKLKSIGLGIWKNRIKKVTFNLERFLTASELCLENMS